MQQEATTSGATVTPESPEHPQSRPASAPCWPMVNTLTPTSLPRVEPQLIGFAVPCIEMHGGLFSLLGTTACLNHSTHRGRLRCGARDLSLGLHHGALGSQAHPGFCGSAFSCSGTQALPVGGRTDLSPALPVPVNSPRPLSKLRDPEQLPTSFDGEDDQMQLVLLRSSESWSQSWGPYQESIAPLLGVQPPRLLKAPTQQLVVSSTLTSFLLLLCPAGGL